MSSVDHAANIAAALTVLEGAWMQSYRGHDGANGIISYDGVVAVNAYLAARRTATAAGYVSVMVSREAVEALAEITDGTSFTADRYVGVVQLLARDLASLLKPDGERGNG